MIERGDMWREFFRNQYGTHVPPVRPLWCSYEALGLSLGRITVMSKPGKLHPMAMNPKVVRIG